MSSQGDCPFCSNVPPVLANEQAYALFDKNPLSPGHLLLITRRHVPDFFDTSLEERHALLALLQQAKTLLDEKFSPQGYNFGVNVGETAGQTIMHVHVHLMPRYTGDTPAPRGGVRGAIPGKRSY